LTQALSDQPELTLRFYPYGIILQKADDNGAQVEYAIAPENLSRIFTQNHTFTTGLLNDDVLFMIEKSDKQLIATYRKPQITGIFLEGIMGPLRVPLPGLVLIRKVMDGRTSSYYLFAVKQRPRKETAPLYHAPLPNFYSSSGSMCTGSVSMPEPVHNSTAADWEAILGSSFGNHMAGGRCESEPTDVRKLLQRLHDNNAKRFPTTELLKSNQRLQDFLTDSY
jgi:PRTRC genetic system protein B